MFNSIKAAKCAKLHKMSVFDNEIIQNFRSEHAKCWHSCTRTCEKLKSFKTILFLKKII